MKLQQIDSQKWKVTIKPDHFRTLMCAAKHIRDGRIGRIPPEANDRLRKMIDTFETERRHLCDVKNATTKKKIDVLHELD